MEMTCDEPGFWQIVARDEWGDSAKIRFQVSRSGKLGRGDPLPHRVDLTLDQILQARRESPKVAVDSPF